MLMLVVRRVVIARGCSGAVGLKIANMARLGGGHGRREEGLRAELVEMLDDSPPAYPWCNLLGAGRGGDEVGW